MSTASTLDEQRIDVFTQKADSTKQKLNLHQILRQLMGEVHISEAELARRTKIPQPTLHRILSGSTKSPRGASLAPLANFFSVTINQLLGEDPLPANRVPGTYNPRIQGWKPIPLLTMRDAALWPAAKEQQEGNWDKWVSTDISVSDSAFAVLVQGNAMAPRFEEGTILVVEPKREPRDRDFVVALIENQTTAIFKQLLVDGEDFYLKSLNGDYRTIHLEGNGRIIGTLIQARQDFLR
jgi:SOS-response transcriptional repressor LexA